MNLNAKIRPLDVLDLLKCLIGSDYLNWAHKNSEIVNQYVGCFRKYLKICEESTADFSSHGRFEPFKHD